MRAKAASFFQHPRWVAALVITMAVAVWSFSPHSIAVQIGRPFPDSFHTPNSLMHFICKDLVNTSAAKGGQELWSSTQA